VSDVTHHERTVLASTGTQGSLEIKMQCAGLQNMSCKDAPVAAYKRITGHIYKHQKPRNERKEKTNILFSGTGYYPSDGK
jgi:hypothetical protein